jgi:hypothetical protein
MKSQGWKEEESITFSRQMRRKNADPTPMKGNLWKELNFE